MRSLTSDGQFQSTENTDILYSKNSGFQKVNNEQDKIILFQERFMCADGGVFYWRGKGTTGQLAGVSAGHALGMA